ncbi:metal-dependent hydrolase [Candidatus Pantoea alvi]|uniref:TatD family hydrolase n=1 Tax=Enterobacter agglomerans TaxID=549 RepID=UPI000CDDBD7A|nr:TatD family hydrolase [Pantoea agglomerans]POW59156.1 metal-dependent hydrolase [Pantoea alvi]UBN55048.1 TatD family hydrolase [Pantoea agglomerans]
MRFTDTHCHFDFPPFAGDERASIARAAEAGVERIIVPAVEASRFARIVSLAAQYPALYAALGLHPIAIDRHEEAHLEQLEHWLRQQPAKLTAIGEIGLDLYMDNPQFARQEFLLDAQLRLAKRYDLPVILHSRRTHDKLALHLRRHDLPRRGVVHGFAGSLQQAQAFIKLGYAIGVGGTLTYERASKTRNTLAQLPLDALLLETDAPDMPLHGFQGEPNRPERARLVWQTLCELRPEPPQAIAEALWRNTCALFSLPE